MRAVVGVDLFRGTAEVDFLLLLRGMGSSVGVSRGVICGMCLK